MPEQNDTKRKDTLTRLVTQADETLAVCRDIQLNFEPYYQGRLDPEQMRISRQHLAHGCFGCSPHYQRYLHSQDCTCEIPLLGGCELQVDPVYNAQRRPFYSQVDLGSLPTQRQSTQESLERALTWFWDRYSQLEKGLKIETLRNLCLAEGILYTRAGYTQLEIFLGYTPLTALLKQINGRYRIFFQAAPRLLRAFGLACCLGMYFAQHHPEEFASTSPTEFAVGLVVRLNDTAEAIAQRHHLVPGKYTSFSVGDPYFQLYEFARSLVALSR